MWIRRTAIPLLFLGAIFGCSGTSQPPRTVVVVIVDTLRRDALGCYGYPGEPSPAIDSLAAQSVRFEQALSSSGWTLPAVASLLTGTWPSIHKATGKKTRLTPISPDLVTAGEVLQAAGFATAAVANAAFLSPLLGLARGFDAFDHRHAFNRDIRRADASVEAALALLKRYSKQDLFLLVHLFDVHLDYDPPVGLVEQFSAGRTQPAPPLGIEAIRGLLQDGGKAPPQAPDAAYVRALYQAEVYAVDQAIADLIAGLQQAGRFEESCFILTADHGEELWDHHGFEHGHSLYDELVRVPLIVKLPESAGAQAAVCDTQVRVLDLMPTVFALYNIAPPTSFMGASLLPILLGEPSADRPVWLESTLYGPDVEAYRSDRYKYIVERRADGMLREELYDWRTDPLEHKNLALERPDLLQAARNEHTRWRAEIEREAGHTRAGKVQDLSPEAVNTYEQSLQALGYTGREEEHD